MTSTLTWGSAFWDAQEANAERLWAYADKCGDLDLQNGKAGCGLDEFNSHKFLEEFDETMTVREMRTNLRSTGAIGEKERPKAVPLIHVLLFKYQAAWHELVNAAQGDNQAEIKEAQDRLERVKAAVQESEARSAEARTALVEAQVSFPTQTPSPHLPFPLPLPSLSPARSTHV